LTALEDPNLVGRVVRNFEKAYHRYMSWPTEPDARDVYGIGVRDGYRAIRPGLHTTYKRGRHEMVAAYASPSMENFHQWRKRAKYLRHQMEFLTPLWPEVVVGTAITLDRLGLILGEDHDLAELLALLRDRPDLCPDPRERSLFFALVAQRRSELQAAAQILGRRIYAEKPVALDHRFGEYWESRIMARETPLDTIALY
ncbi:MAG: CHAD domain-containing protein, partial [Acidimicrobiia bacterium]